MKTCPYCAEEIPNNAKKCKFCAEDLANDIEEDNAKNKENELLYMLKNHLEFIWYDCEYSDNNSDSLICNHASKNKLIILCNKEFNLSFFRIRLRLNDIKKVKIDNKYYEVLNSINWDSLLTKRYFGLEGNDVVISIESTLTGYEKKAFWNFINLIEDEITKYSLYFKDYF